MDWITRPDGSYSLTIRQGDFSQEQHDWARQHPQTGLAFGKVTVDGQGVTLEYSGSGDPLLIDRADSLDEDTLISALCSLAETLDMMAASGVLDVANLQTDPSMVHVSPDGKATLLYASVKAGKSGTSAQAVKGLLMDMIRRVVQKHHSFSTPRGKQLVEMIGDPYMNLDAMCGALKEMNGAAPQTAPVPAFTPAAPAAPVYAPIAPAPAKSMDTVAMHQSFGSVEGINAPVHAREMRVQPVQSTQAAVEGAIRSTMAQLQAAPVQQTSFSMPPQETSMQNRSVASMINFGADAPTSDVATLSDGNAQPMLLNFGADAPTSDEGGMAPVGYAAPAPAGALNFGADAPTSDEGGMAPAGYAAPAPTGALNFGADAPTSDEGGMAPVGYAAPAPAGALNFGADAPTSDDGGMAPAGHAAPAMSVRQQPQPEKAAKAKPEKPAKVKTEKPAKVKKEKPVKAKKEKPVHEDVSEPLTYEEQVRRCWANRMILLVVAVGVILFMLMLLAFASPLAVLVMLLIAAAGAAFAGKQGFFATLVMPKVEKTEPQAPTLGEVFNVKMKLQSVNLGSVVEVTIRQREQILGSSEQLASKPVLNYSGISRQHCKIICMTSAGNDTYYVEDLKSKNGTELNGMRLLPGNRYPLHYGDTLTLAHKYKFVVHSDAY